MKSLDNPRDLAEVRSRLGHLHADTPRRWGRMTAHQMVCHLADAFRNLMGERPISSTAPPTSALRRKLFKWVALYAPAKWPRGMKTRAEADQEQGGTRPSEFAGDVAALGEACDRFLGKRGTIRPHYMFGPLSESEWARWAYLHMDHHLRQFGL